MLQAPELLMNVNFEPIVGGLKVIFLTETKCKIRVTYVEVNCKRNELLELLASIFREGCRERMEKVFHLVATHFQFLTTSVLSN